MGIIFSAQAAVTAWRNSKQSFVHIPADQVVHLNHSNEPFSNCPVVIGTPVVNYENDEDLEINGFKEVDNIHKL